MNPGDLIKIIPTKQTNGKVYLFIPDKRYYSLSEHEAVHFEKEIYCIFIREECRNNMKIAIMLFQDKFYYFWHSNFCGKIIELQ